MRRLITALALVAAAFVIDLSAAKIKARADFDKTFDFKSMQTWDWDASGPGEVKLARSSDDDPETVRRRIEPTLVAAVEKEMKGRGFRKAATGSVPDMRVHYYVLVTVGFATQTAGQFLPSVTEWGIPPYVPSTTSFDIVQRGAIVLDVVSTKVSHVVWRGIAEGDIDKIKDDSERDEMIRDGVRDLVKKLPK
ncbi:MAG TPA: DUF4136 domain-containing protein [Vicinamibacterales bacterium]